MPAGIRGSDSGERQFDESRRSSSSTTVEALVKLQFPPEQIIMTLEKRMKCGIGICGRCNIGGRYVCMDDPVFSWKELQGMVPEL